jgi:hypothetical protein
MKKLLHINANFDAPQFLQNLVERLAYRRYDLGYGQEKMPEGYLALETSSTETYVSGTIELNDEKDEAVRMPFITSFLFTCIKGNYEPYQLIWASSMN